MDSADPAGAAGRTHTNRARAESFGQVAEDYDRYRPGYPAALIDRLASLAGALPVLDIGAGTGREAVALHERGVDVLGVEVDAAMAQVARRNGIDVEVAPFETWDARGRTFALIVCGQAWHWIDPTAGAAKARALLRPGGTLALFWNFGDLEPASDERVEHAYATYAPELRDTSVTRHLGPGTVPGHVAPLRAAGFEVRTERFHWADVETPDHYVARISTHSDHLALPAGRLRALQDGLRAALAGHDTLRLDYTTDVLWCQVGRGVS